MPSLQKKNLINFCVHNLCTKITKKLQKLQNKIQRLQTRILRTMVPGIDGLTPTFFIKYWDLFKADLCTTFQQILREGNMPSLFAKGLIYLIPKSKGHSLDIKYGV